MTTNSLADIMSDAAFALEQLEAQQDKAEPWTDEAATRTRAARALRYMLGRTTKDDALQFLYECQETAGVWSLESIDVEGIMEDARERWEDFPELAELAEWAGSRVAHKWSGVDDVTGVARDWALDLIREYATDRGIELKEID